MTSSNRRLFRFYGGTVASACVLLLLHTTLSLFRIGTVNPLPPLALLLAFSFFGSEVSSALLGLFIGILLDTNASFSSSFNGILLFLIGLISCLIAKHLFNNNIRSALVLGLLQSAFYYFCKWLFFFAFSSSLEDSLGYLLRIGLPSALYTAAFVIPFYYWERYLAHHHAIG